MGLPCYPRPRTFPPVYNSCTHTRVRTHKHTPKLLQTRTHTHQACKAYSTCTYFSHCKLWIRTSASMPENINACVWVCLWVWVRVLLWLASPWQGPFVILGTSGGLITNKNTNISVWKWTLVGLKRLFQRRGMWSNNRLSDWLKNKFRVDGSQWGVTGLGVQIPPTPAGNLTLIFFT